MKKSDLILILAIFVFIFVSFLELFLPLRNVINNSKTYKSKVLEESEAQELKENEILEMETNERN